jgi:hypothetical protein
MVIGEDTTTTIIQNYSEKSMRKIQDPSILLLSGQAGFLAGGR